MLKKHGIIGGLLMLMRVFRLALKKTQGKASLSEAEAKIDETKPSEDTAVAT